MSLIFIFSATGECLNDPPNGENGIATTWDPQSNLVGAKKKKKKNIYAIQEFINNIYIPYLIFSFTLGSLVNYTCPAGKAFNGHFDNGIESYCAENDNGNQLEWTFNSDNIVPDCLGKLQLLLLASVET